MFFINLIECNTTVEIKLKCRKIGNIDCMKNL